MFQSGIIRTLFRVQNCIRRSPIHSRTFGVTTGLYRLPDESNKIWAREQNQSSLTMSEVKQLIMDRLGLKRNYDPVIKSREYLTKFEPKLEDLPPRTMQDSFTSAIIPLSTNLELRDKYTAFLGRVRLGRLMEDMDIFACWVCHQHLYIPNLDPTIHLPYTFVTILVDKIDFTDVIPKSDHDIRISGHISWVGRSSMEIVVWLEQQQDGKWKKLTRALFLFAARNATNTQAAPVNPLKPGNSNEEEILCGGELRKQRRNELHQLSLLKVEPNDDEQKLIHDIFIKTLQTDLQALNRPILPPNSVWLNDTGLSKVIFSHPENRNAHNRVFGGYLMRQALEMAWGCAYIFCKTRPKLEHICDIAFRKAVPVASFMKMKAHVIYTEKNYMQVIVVANIHDAQSGEQFTSNVFYYTLSADVNVPSIIPQSYHEAVWYLEGRRKFNYAMERT